MSAETELLRSFLVSLNFKIDAQGQNKFINAFVDISKRAASANAAISATAGAVAAYVQVFATGMEKLYYSSRRTKSSVENIQAMRFAAKQIGISGDEIESTLETLSATMRRNPGMVAWLNNLGIKTEGRENVEVLTDLVTKLKSMPHYIGANIAEQFGLDEKTFVMLKDKLPEFLEAQRKLKASYKAAGYDAEQAAKDSREYMNTLGELWVQMRLTGSVFASNLLPAFREVAGVTKEVLKDINELLNNVGDTNAPGITRSIFWYLGEQVRGLSKSIYGYVEATRALRSGDFSGAAKHAYAATKGLFWVDLYPEDGGAASGKSGGGGRSVSGKIGGIPGRSASGKIGGLGETGGGTPASGAGGLFASLERRYGLPIGLLDSMWKQESGRGQAMLSPAGAKGHFGFMDKTAAEYGLKDPNDLTASAEAAARMMKNLLGRYGGDLPHALAGYNWGSGNLDKYGLGRKPEETRDYIEKIMGRLPGAGATITQTNQTTIMTRDDPNSIAEAVNRKNREYGDFVRNQLPKLQ